MKYFVLFLLFFPSLSYSQETVGDEDVDEEIEEIQDDDRTWDEITDLLKNIKDVVKKEDEIDIDDSELEDKEIVESETIDNDSHAESAVEPE